MRVGRWAEQGEQRCVVSSRGSSRARHCVYVFCVTQENAAGFRFHAVCDRGRNVALRTLRPPLVGGGWSKRSREETAWRDVPTTARLPDCLDDAYEGRLSNAASDHLPDRLCGRTLVRELRHNSPRMPPYANDHTHAGFTVAVDGRLPRPPSGAHNEYIDKRPGKDSTRRRGTKFFSTWRTHAYKCRRS